MRLASSLSIDANGWCPQVEQRPSPNCDARPLDAPISLIVVHNISLPPDEFGGEWITDLFLNRLDPNAHPYFQIIHSFEVSAHFLIRRDGQIIQYVSTQDRAWHAGASEWRGQTRCNDFSIGIELEGCDSKPFTHCQYDRLSELTQALQKRYPHINGVAGHQEIAPKRKTDPGSCFEWARFERQAQIPQSARSAGISIAPNSESLSN